MRKILVTLGGLAFVTYAVVALSDTPRTVDLRDGAAVERLKESNPAHFEKIQQILAGLLERPKRAEAGWLETNFDARDVDLSRLLIKTSYPPKQLLQFTLDDARYTMHLTRTDLSAQVVPAR
jgi:hypothetical protein